MLLLCGSSIRSSAASFLPAPKPSPTVFDEPRQFWVGAGIVGAGLLVFDRPLHELSQSSSLHNDALDFALNHGVVHLGEFYPLLIAFGLYGYDGIANENRRSLVIASEIAMAPIITQIGVGGVKKVVGRLRPGRTDSPYQFFKGNDSFVSGHAATAFTLATVIAKNYDSQNVAWICYGSATLVSIQRMYDNRHWASDVFFGGLTGYVAGSFSVWLGEKYVSDKIRIYVGNPARVTLKFG